MKKKVTVRMQKVIIFIVPFLFVVIIARLCYISLSNKIDGINLHSFADNRNTKSEVIYAKRGNIYDKNGDVLASTVNSYKIIAYLDPKRTTNQKKPQHVINKEETAKKISEVLADYGMTYEYALERLSKEGVYQVEFGTKGSNIKESDKNKIDALNLPGIDFISGIKRHYSMGSFASYIIGYAKLHEDGDIVGELGIESYYDKDLSGIDGSTTYQTDAYGYTLPGAEVITEDAIDGNDIYLTIDSNIQLFAETLTKSLSDEYSMDWMIFSVMDAKTGAILASSTYPNFDPNDLSDLKLYMNPLVSFEYEPGSTMKIFSFASTIEEGLYNGSATYNSGSIEAGGATIKDFNKVGWGKITYDTGFAYSSNVAAVNLAKKLGAEKLTDYYKKLGFSNKTNIELSNEAKGKIDFHYESELATASFGQGITVTPIQMLQALSSLTNDGTVLKPYIVKEIKNAAGETVYHGERAEVAKVYSKETTDYMQKLMHNVVYNGLSNYWQPSKTILMGKTGTAQIASEKGGYLKGSYDYIRSFAGIFPEEEPKYIVYIAVKQLHAENARPIASVLTKAIDNIISLDNESKENEFIDKTIKINNYISNEVVIIKDELEKKKLKVYTLGDGKYIINQYPLKGGILQEGSKMFLLTNSNNYIMEDLTGWSLNEVNTYANLLGIPLHTTGYGYAISQNILPNTVINSEMSLEVNFSN